MRLQDKPTLEVHPHRREALFYSSIDKIGGTEQKLLLFQTYQQSSQGSSETLIKPILKQKKWMREEEMNEEYLGQTLMMFHLWSGSDPEIMTWFPGQPEHW